MLGLPDDIRACLFDLDGVLTNTAVVHEAAWKEMFDAVVDPPFTHEDYEDFVDGKPRDDGVRDFLKSRGKHPSEDRVQELAERKNQLVLKKIQKDGVDVYEGSRRYLQACKDAGIRRAVVSSSANTPQVLEVTGLDVLVELRVDGNTIKEQDLRGKPAPDSWLYAAKQLGLEPSQCAVFEDATSGVESGKAGGFGLVVGVDRVDHAEALKQHGADIVVQDLAELL